MFLAAAAFKRHVGASGFDSHLIKGEKNYVVLLLHFSVIFFLLYFNWGNIMGKILIEQLKQILKYSLRGMGGLAKCDFAW